jgi:putative membrane protein
MGQEARRQHRAGAQHSAALRRPHLYWKEVREHMQRENRWLWVGLGVLALVLITGPMLGGGMGMMGRGMMGWYGGAGPANEWPWVLGMGIGSLVMLAFWAAVIGLVVLAVRRMIGGSTGDTPGGGESPLAILQRRYAAGEINREQYQEMRQVLEGAPS